MNEPMATQHLEQLVAKHRALDRQVDDLEQHLYLTESERRRVTNLKKKRLAAKDRIAELRRKG